MTGTLDILNVGAGDVTITFDKSNPAEAIRAKRIIKDMLRRGYALLVKMEDGSYQRAKSFDENTAEYIIADLSEPDDDYEPQLNAAESLPPKKQGRPPNRRVKMENATATAVGRSAGG